MLLYLVQHASAKKEEDDPARGLTEAGLRDITRVAQYAGRLDIAPAKIFHSGKPRAVQTAQVLAEHMKPEKSVTAIDGLSPMDDPHIWSKRIPQINEDLVLVGHLPHLGRLASQLLCGDEEETIIDFKMGGIVCLKRFEDEHWAVEWMITPEVVK